MAIEQFVVVGASLSGLRAVETARKSGFTGRITLVGDEAHLPYDRPPLSKSFLEASSIHPEIPFFRNEKTLTEELGIELLLGNAAEHLDTRRRLVSVSGREIPYDAMVIATGTRARQIPGCSHLEGVHPLRTLDDALSVRAALDTNTRVVIIGAGFIGSEVASSARKRGLDVVVIETQPTPLVRAIGEAPGSFVSSLHQRNGTDLRCGTGVRKLHGESRVSAVELDDGTIIATDLVVVGIGAIPNTEWLDGSNISLDEGILCDEYLWTGVPNVYAAGDVVKWLNPVFNRHQRLEHWTSAAEQGAAATRNALGFEPATPYQTVPYFWSDWYDSRIQFVGSTHADEVRVVDGNPDIDSRWIALYRKGDRLVGALTVNAQTEIMKYRGKILQGALWDDAVGFAAQRREGRETRQVEPTAR